MFKSRKPVAAHPGEVLSMIMLENGITQTTLSNCLGVAQTKISQICTGRLGISAEMALKLEKALGMSASLWMNLQKNWELSLVSKEKLKNVRKIKFPGEKLSKKAA